MAGILETLEDRALLTTSVFANLVPVAIPDAGAPVFSDITISGLGGTITQLDVRLSIAHTFDSDLAIFLVAPNGQALELSSNNGSGSDDYINTVFTSTPGVASITTGTAPFTGTFAPEGSLNSLLGSSPNGTWRLRVADQVGADTGEILDWSLEVTTAATFVNNSPIPIPDLSTINSTVVASGLVGNVSQVQVRLDVAHPFDGDLNLFLVAPNGTLFELSTNNGGSGDNYTNTLFHTGDSFPSITTGTSPFTDVFSPEGNIAALQGLSPNGTWTLRVSDNTVLNTGTLNNWSLAITTAANFSAVAAGNTLNLNPTVAGYDVSDVDFNFGASGLTVTPSVGTTINGLQTPQLFAGVTSLTGFAGSGDDRFALRSPGSDLQSTLLLFPSSGRNQISTSGLDVSGFTLIDGSPGQINWVDTNSVFHGVTVLGGQFADSVRLANTTNPFPTTLILSSGNNLVDVNDSSLGSLAVIGCGQLSLSLSSETTVANLLAISGPGYDQIRLDSSTINGPNTLLLGAGDNFVGITGTSVAGSSLIESSPGSIEFTAANSTLGGLLVVGGVVRSDQVRLTTTSVNGPATMLLGGGLNAVSLTSGASVSGPAFVESGAGRLSFNADNSTLASLLIVGGATQGDNVVLNQVTVNSTALYLLGGGVNTLTVTAGAVAGFTLVDSGPGSLNLEINGGTLHNLLVVGGAVGNDAVLIQNGTSILGAATFLLGTGLDQFTVNGASFSTSFTLIALGSSVVRLETGVPNATNTTFGGPALILVGANSTLEFGHDPLPSDPTTFNGSLTIISGMPNSLLRRRNVTTNGLVTLINVNQLP